MRIVVLNTEIVKSDREVEFILNEFPNTRVINVRSIFDVIRSEIDTDIVHIPTHSNVNLLFLQKDVISGYTIGKIFSKVKLCFFNSCLSKDIADNAGIKETISWATEVSERDAVRFSNLFYSALKSTSDTEIAFEIARSQLVSDGYKDLLPIYKKIKKADEADNANFNFTFYAPVKKVIGKVERE
jgi:hypothetical protein